MEFLTAVIGALAAGALAKAGEIGGRAAVDAYEGLRALIVRKLGKAGAVQSLEDDPRSEAAQTALAQALVKAGLANDGEIAQQAKALRAELADVAGTSAADIDIGNITANVNVLVSNLVARDHIKFGNIEARTGDATITNLTADGGSAKKA